MNSEIEIARVLGISPPRGKSWSPLWISHAVADGLPVRALEKLVLQVAPDDKGFIYKLVSKPSLARRRQAGQSGGNVVHDAPRTNDMTRAVKYRSEALGLRAAVLSPSEGAKVARLAKVWTMARQVWGSDADARAFLFRSHPLLDNICPIDVVLSSEHGLPVVEGILGRLQYGSAA